MDCLPVFEPNDYFWEHHQKKDGTEAEEKWETYARVVRQIMANHGGFKTSDLTMDDKLAYKEELMKLYKEGK